MRVYVGNLKLNITGDDVKQFFKKYKVSECLFNRGSRTSFAILKMEDGERACSDMDGTSFKGSCLKVVPAVDREKQGK